MLKAFCIFVINIAPTFAPGTKVYFVSFIISNTYGYNINLKTNLRNPFNDLVIINGQTVSLEVKVSNEEPIMFEAFVQEIGETIKINGVIKYNLRPKENSGNFTVLTLEENPGIWTCHNFFLYDFDRRTMFLYS